VNDALEAATATLFQAPLDEFVAERKRLCAELKAAGDKAAAERLARYKRPTLSVWLVNQLWWQARHDFSELLQAAARVSQGELSASDTYRRALASLRQIANRLCNATGRTASEATLRRVSTTLASLAASGGFAPDAPGALQNDRDPPGFETHRSLLDQTERADERREPPAQASPTADEVRAERARLEAEEQAKRQAERARVEAALKVASDELQREQKALGGLEQQLIDARERVELARARVEQLQARLRSLEVPTQGPR